MTYKEFVEQYLAPYLAIPPHEARAVSQELFAALKRAVLEDGKLIVVPHFGTFHPVKTKPGVRKLGPNTITVPASVHVRFRSAKATKERVE